MFGLLLVLVWVCAACGATLMIMPAALRLSLLVSNQYSIPELFVMNEVRYMAGLAFQSCSDTQDLCLMAC